MSLLVAGLIALSIALANTVGGGPVGVQPNDTVVGGPGMTVQPDVTVVGGPGM
jgi:hypothetical protein